jgi:membrane protein DedA with SNARE-associated domain
LEQFIESIISLNPFWIYLVAIVIAYIENIFPPFPSDVVLVAAGYLCATGRVDFWLVLAVATIGSTTGFLTMYKVGSWFGIQIIKTNRFKFIHLNQVQKVEAWFNKYGYFVVVVNRFLAGTRAVISFFTGLSNLPLWKTMLLASLSSLIWNAILLFAGKEIGSNWHIISSYLETYGQIVTIITITIVLIIFGRGYFRRHNREKELEKSSKSNVKRK